MLGRYDKDLMRRAAAARDCIAEGEDPFRMLLEVVWPDHDWAESAMLARLMECPRCRGATAGCSECGSTGLVTEGRSEILAVEKLASLAYEAT
jgi:hypothetical protein